jgi:hypothetical protein
MLEPVGYASGYDGVSWIDTTADTVAANHLTMMMPQRCHAISAADLEYDPLLFRLEKRLLSKNELLP